MNRYLNDDLTGLDEDQLKTIHKRYDIEDRLTFDDVKLSKRMPIVVCYDYVAVEGDYGFHKNFEEKEAFEYFSKMKELAGYSIEEDIDDLEHEYHFNETYLNKKVKTELKKIFSVDDIPEDLTLYHFGLYTNKEEKADRAKNIKSPRIHFMLGRYGMIYILFYDAYHELC